MENNKKKDFFISYTSADRAWAEWIAWTLEDKGYSTIIDVWDFGPGQSFIRRMYEAVEEAVRIIAIFSPEYFKAKYTGPEWEAVFASDPSGEEQLLIPVRIKPFTPPKFFTSRTYIDFVGENEAEAKEKLLKGVRLERVKPSNKPPFPSTKPNFPNEDNRQSATQKKERTINPHLVAIQKLAQLDRATLLVYLNNQIQNETLGKKRQTQGFIVCGAREEWPESIMHRLNYLITSRTAKKASEPELIQNNKELWFDQSDPEGYLLEYLGQSLGIDGKNRKREISSRLADAENCYIFSRNVQSSEAKNPKLLAGMLSAWQAIKLKPKPNSPNHFLLLVCESEQSRSEIEANLKLHNIENALLPPLQTPPWSEVIADWKKAHIDESNDVLLIDAITQKINDIGNQYDEQEIVPLLYLQEQFRQILLSHPFQ